MSFFTEFINFVKSSGAIVSALSGFIGVISMFISFFYVKANKIKVEEEFSNYMKEITHQRDVKQRKSKVIKMVNNHILSVTMAILSSKQSKSRKKEKEEKGNKNSLIISALFLESKLKKIYKAYIIIGLGSIMLLGTSFYFVVPSYINVIPLVFAILTCSYQFLLNYRIKNGLFGTNDYEAKELIEFIIQNNDKINGNKIFNEEVISNTIIDFSNYVKKVHLLNEH
ncbi:hypothetical protein [Bacillus thuringiensis]|uniref:hypothetical protein n=1 Tax=Bacillus thuringiensis TaxID=1428 RepID=UPI000BF3BBFB|nr:hypothetical protein [Bacillus thuringiensis]PFU70356.1 hypothetical protein COK95_09635 [Bacillus thuringiensis]